MAKPYAERLEEAQINSGVDACLSYAERLRQIVSAITPVERGLAFSLACIRFEELTKILFLTEMRSGSHDRASWARFWKKFRDHKEKWRDYGKWRFLKNERVDQQTARELGEVFAAWASAKNSGLYVEYDPSIGFVQPGLLPSLLDAALRMGDELNGEIRSMLGRGAEGGRE